jgi:hypothetical protein
MNNSSSVSSLSSTATSSSKLTNTQNKSKDSIDNIITINEKVSLTKPQHQVLKIICDTYESSVSEYMRQALVEAMRFDIEEGNFSDALLEKIGDDDNKKNTSSASLDPDLMKSDLDLLKKLQTQIS